MRSRYQASRAPQPLQVSDVFTSSQPMGFRVSAPQSGHQTGHSSLSPNMLATRYRPGESTPESPKVRNALRYAKLATPFGVITMTRGSLLSHAVVCLLTALVSVPAGTWISAVISDARAADNGRGNITLLTQPLADIPGREVRITELDRDPLAASAPHRHPGHHTFGYVAE